MIQAAVRSYPGSRWLSALAWHAGEVLARDDIILETNLTFGSKIYLFARDYGHRHMFFHGSWEVPTTRFLESAREPGWTFLDVGANVGYYSLLARFLGGQTAQIHAFEPNPELFRLLMQSVAAVGGQSIWAVEMACSNRSGAAELYLSTEAGNSGLSTLRSDVLNGAQPLTVNIVTLDDYCIGHNVVPTVIKVDAEGLEIPVLEGANGLLTAQIPRYVICELEPSRAPFGPLRDLMATYRYSAKSISDSGELVPYEDRPFQNIVFARDRDGSHWCLPA